MVTRTIGLASAACPFFCCVIHFVRGIMNFTRCRRPLPRMPLAVTTLVAGVPVLLIGSFVSAVSGGSVKEVETASAPGRDDRAGWS